MRTISSRIALVLVTLAAMTGCAIRDTGIGRLAAYDLECPVEQIELVRDAAFDKTFRGCGREVSYVRSSGGSSPMGIPRGSDGWRVRVSAN